MKKYKDTHFRGYPFRVNFHEPLRDRLFWKRLLQKINEPMTYKKSKKK